MAGARLGGAIVLNYDTFNVQSVEFNNLARKSLQEKMRLLIPIIIEGVNLVESMSKEPKRDDVLISIISDLNRKLLLNILATTNLR